MNKKLIISLLLCLFPVTLFADVTLIFSGGQYYLLTKDSQNKPVNLPVTRIINLDSSVPPPVDSPPPPTNSPLEIAVKNTTTQVLKNGGSSTTAAGISSVYSLAADEIQKNNIQPDKAIDFLKMGVDLILRNSSDSVKWTAWRADISGALEVLQQDGKLSTKEQYVTTLKQISGGMNAASGFNGSLSSPAQHQKAGEGILDNIDIAKLIELIKMLMQLWELFKPR